ncbi:MAG: hypothetical protein ABL989_11860 [Gammaproteobacteria bacterium]
MPIPNLFGADVAGADLDVGYQNLRAGTSAIERAIAADLERLWQRFEPYADPNFRVAFAREPEARFWEMALGVALLDAGKALRPRRDAPTVGGHPDLCVVDGRRSVWIEAIAPKRGDGTEDRVPELIALNDGGRVTAKPVREMQLRISHALWTKKQKFDRYRASGVIAPNDICLIAIGAAHFALQAGGPGFPLALSSVYPIGDEYLTVNAETLEVVGRGFHRSETIPRKGEAIPRSAFLDPLFAPISGLIWSRMSIGNMSRTQRPLSLIHNRTATCPLPQRWGVWDREFVASENESGLELVDILRT